MRRARIEAIALLLAALPLLGAPCSEDKIVDITIGFPTTARLEASGSTNTANSTLNYDLKKEIDVQQALEDAGIDIQEVDKDDIRLVKIEYRVIQPDVVGTRQITNASLSVSRGGNPPAILISGWSGNAGVGNVTDPQAWIDITNLIGTPGLQLLNQYMRDCICFLQGVAAMPNPLIRIDYSGTSSPVGQPTFFEYEVRLTFQGTFPQTFTVPFP